MAYAKQEEIELNQQLEKWKKRQLTAVRKNNIDMFFESMNEIDKRVWEIVANAKSHKDVNYLVWAMAEKVISKYCKLAR